MFFKQPDLTAGARPTLQPDEVLLIVQDTVGLYEGNYKIADRQNGQAYLTSHRIYYIDARDARHLSLYVDLKDVDRYEYQAGFLRSSAKVTIHPKPPQRGAGSQRNSVTSISHLQRLQQSSSSPSSRTSSPFRGTSPWSSPPTTVSANWVCPICTFTNPVPSNFDPAVASSSSIPPCLSCGIMPPIELVLKAVVAAGTTQASLSSSATQSSQVSLARRSSFSSSPSTVACPRCTFHNHSSLRTCEICGAPLPPSVSPYSDLRDDTRAASPAPEIAHININDTDDVTSMKLSFRAGGDKPFYDKLKHAMIQRKWLAANAPPIPTPLDHIIPRENNFMKSSTFPDSSTAQPRLGGVGIAGLEQRGLQTRKVNEVVLGTAFSDLENLMASAKEVVALAERFRKESTNDSALDSVLSESAEALGMVATKDMLTSASDTLYISELSRNLAEYVTDEKRGILRKQGGTMSLVDLWAHFNRTRDGVELVSPSDFQKAAEMWVSLNMPVRLKRFKSGVLAVQAREFSDEKIVEQITRWLNMLKESWPEETLWDWAKYGCGVTAQDAAQRFGWSLGVASEELEMAEEKGALCREDSSEGLKFWLNVFDQDSDYEDD